MENQLKKRISVARGEEKADLLLKNAVIVDVFTGTLFRSHVATFGSLIIGFGEYKAGKTIDLEGKYLCPGFIDGHVHIESSMVSVPEFANAVLPLGTTTIVADPHEIANVMGVEGINYIVKSGETSPLDIYIMLLGDLNDLFGHLSLSLGYDLGRIVYLWPIP